MDRRILRNEEQMHYELDQKFLEHDNPEYPVQRITFMICGPRSVSKAKQLNHR